MKRIQFAAAGGILCVAIVVGQAAKLHAQAFVPGSGERVAEVGDDFEDPNWSYTLNDPKSSSENDGRERLPAGRATNGRWAEGLLRGQPDVIRRVPTPPGGIKGSQGAMMMVSRYTGVPGAPSGQTHQDDLICRVDSILGGSIPVSRWPSVVARVYLPPWEKWERRRGNSFAIRASCKAYMTEEKPKGRFFGGGSSTKLDNYWPGILIGFNPGDGRDRKDSAVLNVRASRNGNDYKVRDIAEPGWWTLGISISPDGQIHYYAHPGVGNLTAKDHLASEYPYGVQALRLDTFFFDVLNADNGGVSTPWIVDDAMLYCSKR